MSSTILEEKHGTCIDLWFYETAARKRGAAFLRGREKGRGERGVQHKDAIAAKRIFSRRTSLKMLGNHGRYSCAFRPIRHKKLSFCGARQFCACDFSARQDRKLREYFVYSRSFLRLSKNLAEMSTDRAAGELEGARPASSTIARRSKSLENQGFSKTAFCVRPKCSAGKRSQKSPIRDFFDKLRKLREYFVYSRSFLCRMGGKGPRKTCRLPMLHALSRPSASRSESRPYLCL